MCDLKQSRKQTAKGTSVFLYSGRQQRIFWISFPPVIASREQPCVEDPCLFSIYEDLLSRERQAFVGSHVLSLKAKL